MRMFIGVALSRAARRHIARIIEGDASVLGRGVVPAENLHITLTFLGEVDARRTEDLSRVMRQAVQGMAPVRISTGATGRFGRNLLYLTVAEGAQELAGVKTRLDAGLERIGIDFDKKPFRPHITLARKADKPDAVDIPAVCFEAGAITLYQSERARDGQIYTPIAEAAFTEGRLRIDRIEGDYAVCENSGGGMVDIPVADLPFEPAEGMLVFKDGSDLRILERGGIKRLSSRRPFGQADQ